MINNIELLAPAGSYEALVAAVQNGANAIYLGGNEFSARAFATNFDHDELKKALRYCRLRNVKVYVTVNTLYEDNQFVKLRDYLLFLSSIIDDIKRGIIISMITSKIMKIGVIIESFLNSLTCPARVFIILNHRPFSFFFNYIFS